MLDDLLAILPFIQNSLVAGTIFAIAAAAIGYFMLVRGLTFAGHALPNIGFAGAAGAVLLGAPPLGGLLIFTIAAGIGIGLLGKDTRTRDITIGVLMTCALGLGLLFLVLQKGNPERVYSILFGTILGVGPQDVLTTALAGLATLAVLLLIARPLLFSSLDPQVAQARGVPIQLLSVLFMVLLAISVSLAIPIIGTLLVFVLLVGPAATATRLTSHPVRAVLLSIGLGVLYVWLGILLAAITGTVPASFFIATISFLIYLPVRLWSPYKQHRRASDRAKSQPAEKRGDSYA
jgi:zinc/manganese transport system permease protein